LAIHSTMKQYHIDYKQLYIDALSKCLHLNIDVEFSINSLSRRIESKMDENAFLTNYQINIHVKSIGRILERLLKYDTFHPKDTKADKSFTLFLLLEHGVLLEKDLAVLIKKGKIDFTVVSYFTKIFAETYNLNEKGKQKQTQIHIPAQFVDTTYTVYIKLNAGYAIRILQIGKDEQKVPHTSLPAKYILRDDSLDDYGGEVNIDKELKYLVLNMKTYNGYRNLHIKLRINPNTSNEIILGHMNYIDPHGKLVTKQVIAVKAQSPEEPTPCIVGQDATECPSFIKDFFANVADHTLVLPSYEVYTLKELQRFNKVNSKQAT
jgi:hypothetical protein